MKKLFFLFHVFSICCLFANAQPALKEAPTGFDVVRQNIPHGKIDTIRYPSKTVGTIRRALIYTPPDYSKKKKYPVLYLLHGIGGDEKEWLNGGHPQVNTPTANIPADIHGLCGGTICTISPV